MKKIVKIIICLSLISCFSGCDPYERTGVEESIFVNHQSLNLFVGDQMQLIASPTEATYNWNSEDPTVVTVSSSGLVETHKEGSTNIIVYNGDIQTEIPVTVSLRISIENIELSETFVELPIEGKSVIRALPIPSNANNYDRFLWSSDNEEVAVVNAMGEVTAIKPGVANITVRAGEIIKSIKVKIYRDVNVALKKTVKVSSILSPVYVGENVVDGILNTSDSNNRWVSQSTNNGPQWIEVDLGTEYEIYSLQFWTQVNYPCPDFQFQKEADGKWIDVFSQTGNSNIIYSKDFEGTSARKVRLYFTKGSSDGIIRMYELCVNSRIYE